MCPFHFDIALPSGEAYRAVAGAASGRDAETSLLRAASAFEANEIAEFTATLPKRNMAGWEIPDTNDSFHGKIIYEWGISHEPANLKGSTDKGSRRSGDPSWRPNGTRRIV